MLLLITYFISYCERHPNTSPIQYTQN